MELLIKDRDYVPDGTGGLVRVSGTDELLQRVLFRLSARRGGFSPLPEVGSRLHLLWSEKPSNRAAAAKKYVAEALRDEKELTVTDVSVTPCGDGMKVTAALRYQGEDLALTVSMGGADEF